MFECAEVRNARARPGALDGFGFEGEPSLCRLVPPSPAVTPKLSACGLLTRAAADGLAAHVGRVMALARACRH
jgi:hypothetical protein